MRIFIFLILSLLVSSSTLIAQQEPCAITDTVIVEIKILPGPSRMPVITTRCGLAPPIDTTPEPPSAADILIIPATDTVFVGDTIRFSAQAVDSVGNFISMPDGVTISFNSPDSSLIKVTSDGIAVALIPAPVARVNLVTSINSKTALIHIEALPVPPLNSLTPVSLLTVIGPLIANDSVDARLEQFDRRFSNSEVGRYQWFLNCISTCLTEPNHYGGLRSRLMWAIRNSLPYGPVADSNSMYGHGRHIVRRYLQFTGPDYNTRADQNTGMADVEALWHLEGDSSAFNHIWGAASASTSDPFNYQNCVNVASDPRQAAIPLQSFNIAHRLGIPFRRAIFPNNGAGFSPAAGSWKVAGEQQIDKIVATCIQSDGKIISKAHSNSEVFFMSVMIVNELLVWARDVEFKQEYINQAKKVMDHIVLMYDSVYKPRGWSSLPYTTNKTTAADDLAGFFIWPSLVMAQEYPNESTKFINFALTHAAATNKNCITCGAKQFNQGYSTMGQEAETLLRGVSWRYK